MAQLHSRKVLYGFSFTFLSALLTLAGFLFIYSQIAAAEEIAVNGISLKYYDFSRGRLAFTYNTGKSGDIYVIDFDRLTISPLLTGSADEDYPSWSPDGQKLAYTSNAGGDRDIYLVNADGSGPKRLTSAKGNDEQPDWSPDGSQLVFRSERSAPASSLFIMYQDGTNQRPLGEQLVKVDASHSFPKWSPRGSEFLFTSNDYWPGWDVLKFNEKTKTTTLMTKGFQSFCRAAWYPAGGAFLLSYGAGAEVDIWNFEKGGDSIAPLIVRPGRDYDGIWTEDGERIIFAGELNEGKGDFQLFVWIKKDNSIHQIAEGKGAMRFPTWTPIPSLGFLKSNKGQTNGDTPAPSAVTAK